MQAVEGCPTTSIKYSLNYLSDRISASNHQDLFLVNPDGSAGKRISELLYFEPYSLLTSDLIQLIFSNENADHSMSDSIISELAACLWPCNNVLVEVFVPHPWLLAEKCKMDAYLLGDQDEISKCKHILEAWIEQQGPAATHRKFRQELDKYSIFCGRNPLNLVCANYTIAKL